MGPQGSKVLIISLDGATFTVLNPLVKQGYLPNIASLMSHSVVAELESVVPPVTAPAWTSFMTGKHPNKHGIFDFSQFRPENYSWTINNAQNIQSKTIWQLLSEKGKRIVVLNLPYTYPPYEINGLMVSGWDAPFTEGTFSYPAGVSRELIEMFPDYKNNLWVSELQPLRSDTQFTEFTGKLKAGFEQQTKFALHLLDRENWDVFMVHFQQTDWVQHKLWTYIEQACNHPSDRSPKIEATRECYRRFDELIELLIERTEPLAATTILLSDHGFGRLMGSIHANSYLTQWGYLSVDSEGQGQLNGVKNLLRKSKLKPVRDLYRSLAQVKNNLRNEHISREHDSWADNAGAVLGARGANWYWSRTKAVVIYAYQMGFVFVNVIGRGPLGSVAPGREYEELLSDLISRFRKLRHPHSGEKLLQDVVRGADIYPAADNGIFVPDLVLIPVDGYGFSFSLTNAPPEISQEGTHRHNGILLIKGKSVVRPQADFHPNLIDLAPTILRILDLPVPSDMDGRVLEEILISDQPVCYEDVDNSVLSVAQSYSPEEAEIVEQRLRSLGYLD